MSKTIIIKNKRFMINPILKHIFTNTFTFIIQLKRQYSS